MKISALRTALHTGHPAEAGTGGLLSKFLLVFVLVLCCLFAFGFDASADETCSIDGEHVLLYKVINWWHDSLPEESQLLCGHLLKYRQDGQARVRYDEAAKNLEIGIAGGFADQLSLRKTCENRFGPSSFQCLQLNQKYFGSAAATIHMEEASGNLAVRFDGISRKQAVRVQKLEQNVAFVVEGVIGGLAGDRIALHRSGEFHRSCPAEQGGRHPIKLTVMDAPSGEVLAACAVVYSGGT